VLLPQHNKSSQKQPEKWPTGSNTCIGVSCAIYSHLVAFFVIQISRALQPSLGEAVKIHLQRKEPGGLTESLLRTQKKYT
jgi:hypothetical protein